MSARDHPVHHHIIGRNRQFINHLTSEPDPDSVYSFRTGLRQVTVVIPSAAPQSQPGQRKGPPRHQHCIYPLRRHLRGAVRLDDSETPRPHPRRIILEKTHPITLDNRQNYELVPPPTIHEPPDRHLVPQRHETGRNPRPGKPDIPLQQSAPYYKIQCRFGCYSTNNNYICTTNQKCATRYNADTTLQIFEYPNCKQSTINHKYKSFFNL